MNYNYVYNNPQTTRNPVEITPEMAQDILDHHNENNRKLRGNHVDKLAIEMRKGNWRLSNDNICFDVNGNLINGQHRLKAVVCSGVTIKAFITYGLPKESFNVMDTPQNRNEIDVIKHKYPEINHLNGVCKIMNTFAAAKDNDKTKQKDLCTKMTNEEKATYVYEHQGLATLALHIKNRTVCPMSRAPFIVACMAAYINGAMTIEDIDALIETGKHNIPDQNKYNVKPVLDYTRDLEKTVGGSQTRAPEEETWEKVIYKFVNNVKSVGTKKEFYPCTKETIKTADEKLRREML